MGLSRRWRRNWATPRLPVVLAIGLIIMLVLIWFLEMGLRPTISAVAEAQARWTATEIVHQAILEQVVAGTSYQDLVDIDKDAQGKIVMMRANLPKANQVASSSALAIQAAFQNMSSRGVPIPLGQVTGSKLLAYIGPAIRLNMIPLGTVQVTPLDSFEAAGFNQTRHRIYLQVESQVKVIVPLMASVIVVTNRVPIADTILLGEVPNQLFLFNGSEGLIGNAGVLKSGSVQN